MLGGKMFRKIFNYLFLLFLIVTTGCTVKAVGDPNRPITIKAHVTIDIKGLENTATDIEDFVSGKNQNLENKGE
jgi:hypothetical protein